MNNIFIDEFDEVVLYKDEWDSPMKVHKVAPGGGDSFDPYIGVALAYCYQMFGSKKEFQYMVDELRERCKNAKRERIYTLDDGRTFQVKEDKYGWI